jgi:putative spermidine/putrescine transport system ATP-binding protein
VVQRDAAGWCIRLEGGASVRCADPGVPPGREAAAIVRPERVIVEPAAASPGAPINGLLATVTDVIYLGQSLRYHLQSGQGREVVAISSDRGARFAAGATVRLTWRPDDVWVIPQS